MIQSLPLANRIPSQEGDISLDLHGLCTLYLCLPLEQCLSNACCSSSHWASSLSAYLSFRLFKFFCI
ncbi:hypothetical protein I7I50_04921 [Histoplasma capsulatum G186AR]|uniref:Uncharacterized protein n=1 Tax=Ajellomyces capsulatus TaxID=5037 RepID=A0A8H8D8J6_AJECA|nr:hypothetical protein I7I52_03179 [Histoplasma capsulatum]QSS75701.1 hypothetical protein I7I50_04921 [Histoplasma capsulatum G186AR]